ncbi:hypothetical protein BH20BAC1_BH20BAC1_09400 [soil metagenome]
MDSVKLAENIFNKHATAYLEKFKDVSLYQESLDIFCNMLPKNASVLEVGTGPGNVTKYILQQRPDLKLTGIDIAGNMIDLAQINNPSGTFIKMDCRDIYSLTNKYNGIISSFCFPYLSQEEVSKFMKDVKDKLTDGGIIYISTMEGDYASSGLKTTSAGESLYIHYHEYGFLSEVLIQNQFEIVDTRRKQYKNDGDQVVTDLLMIARL